MSLLELAIDLAGASSPITQTLNYSVAVFHVLCLNPSKSKAFTESQPTHNTEGSENFKSFYLCSPFRAINRKAWIYANAHISSPALLEELQEAEFLGLDEL